MCWVRVSLIKEFILIAQGLGTGFLGLETNVCLQPAEQPCGAVGARRPGSLPQEIIGGKGGLCSSEVLLSPGDPQLGPCGAEVHPARPASPGWFSGL